MKAPLVSHVTSEKFEQAAPNDQVSSGWTAQTFQFFPTNDLTLPLLAYTCRPNCTDTRALGVSNITSPVGELPPSDSPLLLRRLPICPPPPPPAPPAPPITIRPRTTESFRGSPPPMPAPPPPLPLLSLPDPAREPLPAAGVAALAQAGSCCRALSDARAAAATSLRANFDDATPPPNRGPGDRPEPGPPPAAAASAGGINVADESCDRFREASRFDSVFLICRTLLPLMSLQFRLQFRFSCLQKGRTHK